MGGDVIKFVELRDKVGFGEAVRTLAQRFGIPVPETREARDPDGDAEREALLKHARAGGGLLPRDARGPGGRGARGSNSPTRGIDAETVERLGLGFAPLYREGLKSRLLKAGFALPLLVKSGLVCQRDTGETVDRFRTRLMIPIVPGVGLDRGVRRAGDAAGPAAEVPELAGDADLRRRAGRCTG